MNAFARARLDAAIVKLEIVEGTLGANRSDRSLAELLHRARGDLLAMEQLLAMEDELAEERAPRPKTMPPIPLRVGPT